jgi:hypothetical protein
MAIDGYFIDKDLKKDAVEKVRVAKKLGYDGFHDAIISMFYQGMKVSQIVVEFNAAYGGPLISSSTVYDRLKCMKKIRMEH